jgi:hypothetical protein
MSLSDQKQIAFGALAEGCGNGALRPTDVVRANNVALPDGA